MYELRVERTFCAAHAVVIDGTRESVHGHNWTVTATIVGPTLNSDGLLCDFHLLERLLERIVGRFDNRNLNESPPFDRTNPTAENVARFIADALAGSLPAGLQLLDVSVTEAPGCTAAYRLD